MESDQTFFNCCLITFFLITPATFIALQFLTTPYGKHHKAGWGPNISPPLGWFMMESPTIWLTLLLFPYGKNYTSPLSQILIAPYLLHYFHRTIIYPLRMCIKTDSWKSTKKASASCRESSSGFPLIIALIGFAFNLLNAYLQSRWVSHYAVYESDSWFWLHFAAGLAIFITGMAVNMQSDKILLRLKSQGGGYKIPTGGCFEWVSCANYFGEILEWLGWAVMTWSWIGFGFFLYTCTNLVPRAKANHRWYMEKFGSDYPRNRKIVIPFVY